MFRAAVPAPIARALRKADQFCDPYARRCYSQEGEDILLDRLLDGQPSGFYLDVGAHHPWRFSNTFLFYLRGWRGINIDPDPDAIALFERVRPADVNIAMGVADAPGELRFYRFSDPALNTFDAALAAERKRLPEYHLVGAEDVKVERLDRLLAARLPTGQAIDFLSVDAEGFDLRVLKSNDWTRYRPHWVLAECLGTSVETVFAEPLHRYMHDMGYELMAKTLNTLFYRDRGDAG
jgi:FkbM family methyltransferase